MQLKQTKATYLPESEAVYIIDELGIAVDRIDEDAIMIQVEGIWIKINLVDDCYCIGIPEG